MRFGGSGSNFDEVSRELGNSKGVWNVSEIFDRGRRRNSTEGMKRGRSAALVVEALAGEALGFGKHAARVR